MIRVIDKTIEEFIEKSVSCPLTDIISGIICTHSGKIFRSIVSEDAIRWKNEGDLYVLLLDANGEIFQADAEVYADHYISPYDKAIEASNSNNVLWLDNRIKNKINIFEKVGENSGLFF